MAVYHLRDTYMEVENRHLNPLHFDCRPLSRGTLRIIR